MKKSAVMLAVAGALALAGCAPQAARPATSPSPGPASPSSSASPALPGPPAQCRIPITGAGGSSKPESPQGGFMDYPSGNFKLEADSVVTGWTLPPNTTTPYYDLAIHRWIPVRYSGIAPDGKRYAYVEYTGQGPNMPQPVHIVDIASGKDTQLLTGEQDYDDPDWQPEGIYLRKHPVGTDFDTGLFLVNPDSAAVKTIETRNGGWDSIGAGAAWAYDLNATNSTKAGSDTILRLDLASGKMSRWLSRPGRVMYVAGADAKGLPFVVDWTGDQGGAGGDAAIYHLTAPDRARQIYPRPGLPKLEPIHGYPAQPDGVRTWLSSTAGVLLYTDADGLKLVGGPGYPIFTGGCR